MTGKAARSIQSLDGTKANYSIAIDILKEKFDCHHKICMRHWAFIYNYLQITTETPETVEDFLETVKMNLRAPEKLGEPVTSNVVHHSRLAMHLTQQKNALLYTSDRVSYNTGEWRSNQFHIKADKGDVLPTSPSTTTRATRTS